MKKLGVSVLLIWLVAIWVFFILDQRSPAQEDHTGDYVSAMLKVTAVVLVATSLGLYIMGAPKPGLGDLVPASAVGLVLLGLASLLLGSLGAIKPHLIWVMLAALSVLSYRQVGLVVRRVASTSISSHGLFETGVLAIMGFALLVCLINCLAPLTANDALVYHLNLPKIYASNSGLVRLPSNAYANMPHNGEMLYTLFYSVAGETGARIFYFFLLVAATGAIYTLARRFVAGKPALIGASIFLVQPLVIDHRTVCNVDIMLAYFYVSAAIIAFDQWRAQPARRPLAILSLLAGFMLGIKYTAIAPCLMLLVILMAGSPRRPDYKALLLGLTIALVVFVPWAIKNERFVRNPVYPMLEGTFDGRNWDTTQEAQLLAWQRGMGMGRSPTDYLLLPLNISLKGKPGLNYTRFDGTMSPLFLMLLPLALFKRRRETTVLILIGAGGFVFWAVTSQQLRFLIPSIALLAVLVSLGFSSLSHLLGGKWIGAIAGLILLVEVSLLWAPDQYGRPLVSNTFGDRLPVVTGLEAKARYLERTVQSFSMFDHIDRTLPRGAPVFMVWENRAYYLRRPYFADSFFEASTVMRMVSASGNAETFKRTLSEMGYGYVLVNDLLGSFFSKGYRTEDRKILEDLIASHLKPLHSVNRLTLYSLLPD